MSGPGSDAGGEMGHHHARAVESSLFLIAHLTTHFLSLNYTIRRHASDNALIAFAKSS